MKPWEDYTYPPRPMTAKPTRETPYDQTKARPSTVKGTGKYGGMFPQASGGGMNTGGKRRPQKEQANDTYHGVGSNRARKVSGVD